MHPWYNLSPVVTEHPCTPVEHSKQAVKRDLSRRRSLRSSVRTASLTLNNDHDTMKGPEARTSRASLAMLLEPLSTGSCASYAPAPSRQRSGSAVHTSTYTSTSLQTHAAKYTNRTLKHHSRARDRVLRHSKCPRPRVSATRGPIRSLRTKLLLRYAQQVIEGSIDASKARPRRPRFVMDVLLDLQSLRTNDDVIAELLRSFHQSIVCLSRYAPAAEYSDGRMSLDKSWIEGPAHWAGGTRTIEDGISTRFPESYERSTAFQTV